MLIRNDSAKPLQCVTRFDSAEFDLKNEGVVLIAPGETERGHRGVVSDPAARPPYNVECHFLAEKPPGVPPADYLCSREPRLEYGGRPLEPADFYPPGSIRRRETGIVVVEFLPNRANRRAEFARVVASSGYLDLDRAAWKLTQAFVMGTKCRGSPMQVHVRFSNPSSDPPSGDAMSGRGTVEILDP